MMWLRKNLFRSIGDGITTVVVSSLAALALFFLTRFIFVTGRWEIIRANLGLLMHRVWPAEDLWRLIVVMMAWIFLAFCAASISKTKRGDLDEAASVEPLAARALDLASRVWPVVLVGGLVLALTATIGPLIVAFALVGSAVLGRFCGSLLPGRVKPYIVSLAILLSIVGAWVLNHGRSWDDWGGFFFNVFISVISIALCFPVGVILALGRRSEFPVLRWLSIGFIEIFRGAPLIAWLLMAKNTLKLFYPLGADPPGLMVRGLVVLVLFTAAYVAEIVRGGLQSVPKGQIEAARANGLTPIPTLTRIVLPQAIKNVIPALVGQSISLFKDSTLVGFALGFAGLLKLSESITQQDGFKGQGLIFEATAFVMLLFWAGSYTMSRESQRLESKLGVGSR